MRIFSNVTEMMKEIERELFEMGINNHPCTMQDKNVEMETDFQTKELLGYSYGLTEWPDIEEVFNLGSSELKLHGKVYCRRELEDRLSRDSSLNPGHAWKARKETWSRFLEEDSRFAYTYSERLAPQLNRVIDELDDKPGSRQCVMTIYDQHHDLHSLGGIRRVPCSMYYQFLQRKINGVKCLSLIYTMRSCDYYAHFPIDLYLAIKLLEYVANRTDSKPTNFIHFMGSLHAYRKDWKGKEIF